MLERTATAPMTSVSRRERASRPTSFHQNGVYSPTTPTRIFTFFHFFLWLIFCTCCTFILMFPSTLWEILFIILETLFYFRFREIVQPQTGVERHERWAQTSRCFKRRRTPAHGAGKPWASSLLRFRAHEPGGKFSKKTKQVCVHTNSVTVVL